MKELQSLVEIKDVLLESIEEINAEIESYQIFTPKVLGFFGFNFIKETNYLKVFEKDTNIPEFKIEIMVNQLKPTSVVISITYNNESNTFEFTLKSFEDLKRLLEQLNIL